LSWAKEKMSNQTNTAPKNKQAEAEEYLKKHKIAELFDNITAHLVFNQPGFFIFLHELNRF